MRFLQQTITAIDPEGRRVTTDAGEHDADVLVVALGADYDLDATPGLAGDNEFYSWSAPSGCAKRSPRSCRVARSSASGAPFKCPPAPSEAALLLHDYLSARGVRDVHEISFVIPFGSPVRLTGYLSRACCRLRGAWHRVRAGPTGQRTRPRNGASPSRADDEVNGDLFLSVPKHRAPDVVIASGMTVSGYVPVNPETLETRFPGVYAFGDVATIRYPRLECSPRERRVLSPPR